MIDIDKLDKKLWSPESLARPGPFFWPTLYFTPPWRDVLRDPRSTQVGLLLVNCIYFLAFLIIDALVAYGLISIILDNQYSYLWLAIALGVVVWATISFLKDIGKLIFYLYISKRSIEDVLQEETRKA